jgi:DNA polymerase III subunit delta
LTEASASSEKPVVYILHGDDDYEINRFVEKLYSRMGDPAMADLNTSRLDGRGSSEEEIRTAANAIPFLAERRLVILTNPLARVNSPEAQGDFRTFLNNIPPSTALVMIIEDTRDRKGWKNLSEKNWLIQWAQKASTRAFVQSFLLPQGGEMVTWIRKKAKEQGGQFDPSGASALAMHVGSDTRTASHEIEKLLTYVDFRRPVMAEDVEMLTAPGGQVNVFDLTEALASGNTTTALRLLHRLLDDQDAAGIFPLVIRQFRQLIMASEILLERGSKADIERDLGVPSFVADRLEKQARRFSMPALEKIYHRLLEMDEASKTSQMALDLALDALIVEAQADSA